MERTSLPFDFSSTFFNRSAKLVEILGILPVLRSDGDVRKLANELADIPFLSSYRGSDEIEHLAREFDLAVVKKGEAVYREGEAGESFYVIIEGAVQILATNGIAEDGSLTYSLVADLRAGQSFGEAALMKDDLRPNTAMAREPTKLMRLQREAYERVLKNSAARQLQAAVSFFESLPNFEDVPRESVMELVVNCKPLTYQNGTLILSQGQITTGVHFIRSGYVKLLRTLTPGMSEDTVVIDELEVGDMFGDVAALSRQPLQYSVLSNGRVDCFFVEKLAILRLTPEQLHRFKNLSKPYPSDSVLLTSYAQTKRWQAYKAELLSTASKEKAIRKSLAGHDIRNPEVKYRRGGTAAAFKLFS